LFIGQSHVKVLSEVSLAGCRSLFSPAQDFLNVFSHGTQSLAISLQGTSRNTGTLRGWFGAGASNTLNFWIAEKQVLAQVYHAHYELMNTSM